MISLMQLLKEVQGEPKAIILAGAPGAGKGFILRGLDLGGLKVLNVDDIFVKDNFNSENVTYILSGIILQFVGLLVHDSIRGRVDESSSPIEE